MTSKTATAALAATLAMGLITVSAEASTIQTFGSGSAVSTVDASASFENQRALFDNPYLESGLSFSRSNLTFDNNGCGFAGCGGAVGFAGFSGNYMYGVGFGGYFTISTTGGQIFTGLEFLVGTGWGLPTSFISWQTLLNGNVVGSGNTSTTTVPTIGFSNPTGFDKLIFTATRVSCELFVDCGVQFAPAFDTLTAQFATVGVPGPIVGASLPGLMLAALGMLGWWRRRKKID